MDLLFIWKQKRPLFLYNIYFIYIDSYFIFDKKIGFRKMI
jgi:hypothetical protein